MERPYLPLLSTVKRMLALPGASAGVLPKWDLCNC